MMIFPVVFHRRLIGLWIATVSSSKWAKVMGISEIPFNHFGIEVVKVIGQCFGLGCFGTTGWPKPHCHCPRNLGEIAFSKLSEKVTHDSVIWRPLNWTTSKQN